MTVNRYTLRHNGMSDKDIQQVNNILSRSSVRRFDKMVLSDRNYLVSTTHFDIKEFAQYQRERITKIRPISAKPNSELLKKIDDIINKIIIS